MSSKARLPLPRSWLSHPPTEDVLSTRPDRELVLSGRGQTPGTKAHLRHVLLNAGWNVEDVEAVTTGKFIARNGLTDVTIETAPDFNKMVLALKDLGISARILDKEPGTSLALVEQWDSFTRHPWWLSAQRGQRQILTIAKTQSMAKRATASFYRDLWSTVGDEPEHRMPDIRRINILSFMSSDGVSRFQESLASKSDLVVVHGLDTRDNIYQMLGYVEAMSQVAPHALFVYECVPAPDLDADTIVSAAKRSGFSFIWGVARG